MSTNVNYIIILITNLIGRHNSIIYNKITLSMSQELLHYIGMTEKCKHIFLVNSQKVTHFNRIQYQFKKCLFLIYLYTPFKKKISY